MLLTGAAGAATLWGMEPYVWIILAAVVVVLLIVLLLIVGAVRRRNRTISFEEKKEEPRELTREEKSGNYQAQGGFSFSAGPAVADEPKEKEPEILPGQELGGRGAAGGEAPAKPVIPPAVPPAPAGEPAPEVPRDAAAPGADAPAAAEPAGEEPPAPVDPEAVPAEPAADTPAAAPTEPVVAEPEDRAAEAESQALHPEAEPVPEAADAPAEAVDAGESVTAPAPETPAQIDEIDRPEGRLGRLRGRLARSQSAIGDSVLGLLGAGDLDEDAWEEIEDTLIMADLGTESTMSVVDKLRERIASRGVSSEAEARALLREVLIEECGPDMDRSIRALPHEGKPAVILVVGVNGTGKTTTVGKLARVLVAQRHTVLLGAADTFRAAAADQLETWGRRVGADTVRGAEGADPASVAYDAVATGVDQGTDVVLIDTAGRLHTSKGLMDQLDKVKRVVEKKAAVDEVILVLDATVGQNGIMQARIFRDVVDITGVALTKLDGTAKGGIVFQVQRELGVPVKLVGLGEGADHLAPFEPEGFVDALLGDKR